MGKQILYIEDNLDNMNIVRKLLEAQGYSFLWSGNGIGGVAIAKRLTPDLILVDLTLPDIDGFEVIKRLRNCGDTALKYAPIIAITGRTSQGDVDKALNEGCDVYMVKPVNLRELNARVEGFLGV